MLYLTVHLAIDEHYLRVVRGCNKSIDTGTTGQFIRIRCGQDVHVAGGNVAEQYWNMTDSPSRSICRGSHLTCAQGARRKLRLEPELIQAELGAECECRAR